VAFHPAGHRRLLRKARGVDLIPPEEQEGIRENLPHLPKKRSEECVRRIRGRVEHLAEQPRLGALRKTRVFQSLSWSIDRFCIGMARNRRFPHRTPDWQPRHTAPASMPRQVPAKTGIFEPFIIKTPRSFCQDRLGTNIGKTQKKMPFFAPLRHHPDATLPCVLHNLTHCLHGVHS
jgi:hypothetical protein